MSNQHELLESASVSKDKHATLSLIYGIVSVILLLLPYVRFVSIILAITGLYHSRQGHNAAHNRQVLIGKVLCILSLVLVVLFFLVLGTAITSYVARHAH